MRRLMITTTALAALMSLGAVGAASAEPFVPRTATTAPVTVPHGTNGRVDLDHVRQPAARPDSRDQDAHRNAAHTATSARNDDGRRVTTEEGRAPARVMPRQAPARGKKVVHPKHEQGGKRSGDRDSR